MRRAILSDFSPAQLSALNIRWQEHCNERPERSRWISLSPPEQQKGGMVHSSCHAIQINEQWVLHDDARDRKIICIHEMCEFVLGAATNRNRDALESYIIKTSNIQRGDVRTIRRLADEQLGLGQFEGRGCLQDRGRYLEEPTSNATTKISSGLVVSHIENPVCQHSYVWDELLPFVEKVKHLPLTDTKLSPCFEHIKDVPRFGRIPHIYVDSGLCLGRGSSALENADALYFDQTGADLFLRSNPNLKGKVLVIRDRLPRTSFEDFISYHSQWPHRMVDIQDFSTNQASYNCVKPVVFSSVLADLQDPNPRLSLARPPRNLLNLASRTYRPRPQCLTQDRYKLIDELVYEARCYAANASGKTSDYASGNHIITDFEDCLGFEILGQAYTASGWHKDSSGAGTWVRCESGVKLWPIIASLTDQQRDDFVAYGEEWRPGTNEVPVLALFPGDTLVMLAGNDNVHAPITMVDCYMTGGIFWDSQSIKVTLRQILQQDSTPRISNEPLQTQLRFIVQALYFRSRRFPDTALENLCKDVLLKFSSCSCVSKCSRYCTCKVNGFDCTIACHDESSVCVNRISFGTRKSGIRKGAGVR